MSFKYENLDSCDHIEPGNGSHCEGCPTSQRHAACKPTVLAVADSKGSLTNTWKASSTSSFALPRPLPAAPASPDTTRRIWQVMVPRRAEEYPPSDAHPDGDAEAQWCPSRPTCERTDCPCGRACFDTYLDCDNGDGDNDSCDACWSACKDTCDAWVKQCLEDAYTDADHLTDADIDLMAQTVAAGISSAAKM